MADDNNNDNTTGTSSGDGTESETVSRLEQIFNQVVELVRNNNSDTEQQPTCTTTNTPSTDEKLRFYGLYKRVRQGPASASDIPSVLRIQAYAKYQAHVKCSTLSKEQAMRAYVQLVADKLVSTTTSTTTTTNSELSEQCRCFLEELNNDEHIADANTKNIDEGSADNKKEDEEEKDKDADAKVAAVVDDDDELDDPSVTKTPIESTSTTTKSTATTKTTFGIQPLIPRGQLDIGYHDLCFAARECLLDWCFPTRRQQLARYQQLHELVGDAFFRTQSGEHNNNNNNNVVTGLAARSLLDLYLQVKSFPEDSEIIMTPPMNVPGMLQVLDHYRLRVVGVDIPSRATDDGNNGNNHNPHIAVDLDAIRRSITDKTVAIMVVHPFGIISANNESDMKGIREIADSHKIDVLEDCAEVFTGTTDSSSYQGSVQSDLILFSFGFIKTRTALGGGVAILRDTQLAVSMRRMQSSVCDDTQTTGEFFQKVVKAFLVRFVVSSPWLFGLLFTLCRWMGVDFDKLATTVVRGFGTKGQTRSQYINSIRKRPCPALLALLNRRLRQTNASIKNRIKRCSDFSKHIIDSTPGIQQPSRAQQHTFWLYPIFSSSASNAKRLALDLRKAGFDATQGATQLVCVDLACPRTASLMKNVVYLPIASQALGKVHMDKLARTLRSHEELNFEHEHDCLEKSSRPRHAALALVFAVCGLVFSLRGVLVVLRISFLLTVIRVAFVISLNYLMGEYYLDSSDALAGNLSSLENLLSRTGDIPKGEEEKSITKSETDAEENSLVDSLGPLKLPVYSGEKRKVILTGATGFLGSMVLYDLLIKREALGIDQVILICRSKKGMTAGERIHKLLAKPMFNFLSIELKERLVRPVEGDVTKVSMGISENELTSIMADDLITRVIHVAAAVSFTQTLPDAARSNITSTLIVQDFASKLPNGRVRFVHVSTAFVHGGCTGSEENPLGEDLFDLGSYDARDLYDSMVGTEFLASQALQAFKFPNTYTFSKSVCEHLILRNNTVRTIVIRPSIIGPSISKPYEGWAGSKPSTIVAAAGLYLAFQWNLWCFGNYKVPCIPVDVVARLVLSECFSFEDEESDSTSSAAKTDCSLSSEEGYEKVVGGNKPTCTEKLHGSCCKITSIRNAVWHYESPPSTSFTWMDYASFVTQTGCVFGHFNRTTAYVGLLVSTRVLPWLGLSLAHYRLCHSVFVDIPVKLISGLLPNVQGLRRIIPFLDLPLMFFPFMNSNFTFRSELMAPREFDGRRYGLTSVVAAHLFVRKMKKNHDSNHFADANCFILNHPQPSAFSTFWWTISQPKGSWSIRFLGFVLSLVCDACFDEIKVNLKSIAAAIERARLSGQRTVLVLAPTHRSFFDFMLLSMLAFSLPELQLDIPSIVAASEFHSLPFLGWLASKAGAIFVTRGLGKIDDGFQCLINDRLSRTKTSLPCIEVFIEGTRSRDRRFVVPRTGVLKSLRHSGINVLVLPIAINYERTPEQSILAAEIPGVQMISQLSTGGAFSWLKMALCGNIELGSVSIIAGESLCLNEYDDMRWFAEEVQAQQRRCLDVSIYHIRTTAQLLKICPCSLKLEIERTHTTNAFSQVKQLKIPTDSNEMLQVSMQLASMFSFPTMDSEGWERWLNSVPRSSEEKPPLLLIEGLRSLFVKADRAVDEAIARLKSSGQDRPMIDQVLEVARSMDTDSPSQLLAASISMKIPTTQTRNESTRTLTTRADTDQLVSIELDSGEMLGAWGFPDSGFVVRLRTRPFIAMKGNRYRLSGRRLSHLLSFIQRETGTRVNLKEPASHRYPIPNLDDSFRRNEKAVNILQSCTPEVSFLSHERIRHGTGHCQQDIYAIRQGLNFRVPDAVAWPRSDEEVSRLTDAATKHQWCLIPFGGGTNVTQATRAPEYNIEPRPIVSVDMRRMKRILWLNEEDGLAHVQAGITGRELAQELATYRGGYTCGHQPDSYEFSTLGGWVATKASGMKRAKYGNIENIVKGVCAIGSKGKLVHGVDIMNNSNKNVSNTTWGRESCGVDIMSLFLGSEGCLGIITSVVIRVWKLPQVVDHQGILFNDFDVGVLFARAVSRMGSDMPASCRLLDNAHFRLGQALRPDPCNFGEHVFNVASKGLVQVMRPELDSQKVVCATLTFEGSPAEVRRQKTAISKIAKQLGGLLCGSSTGQSGYELTFLVAYLRDFAMSHHILGESFETFAPWSKLHSIVSAVRCSVQTEHSQRIFLPGRPFVGCRITQMYHEGACIYFYLCMSIQNVNNTDASAVFAEIEDAARKAILLHGGSLSHHHGIGKVRGQFLSSLPSRSNLNRISAHVDSPALVESAQALKRALDPENVFGARNGYYFVSTDSCSPSKQHDEHHSVSDTRTRP